MQNADASTGHDDGSSAVRESPKKRGRKRRSPRSRPVCGIIMPISAIDGCSEQHWSDVRKVLEQAIESAGFVPRLVSDAGEVGIIQKRIIQNVYTNPVLVCDVSGKNPNVMFELGMRLAFDRPTIIVKDDKTAYSFDTAPIEHLEYPRDLRFARIVDFQQNLASKIEATHRKAQSDKDYTTFLKHFGSFAIPRIEPTPLERDDLLLDEVRMIRSLLLSEHRTLPAAAEPDDRILSELSSAQHNYLRRKLADFLRRIRPSEFRSLSERNRALSKLRERLPAEKACRALFSDPHVLDRAVVALLQGVGWRFG